MFPASGQPGEHMQVLAAWASGETLPVDQLENKHPRAGPGCCIGSQPQAGLGMCGWRNSTWDVVSEAQEAALGMLQPSQRMVCFTAMCF